SLTARDREKLERKSGIEKTPAERESEDQNPAEKKKLKKEDDLIEVVFVIEDGIAKMRQVEIGISDENYYEVKNGLADGEEVVTGPFRVLSRTLKEGDKVEVKNKENEFSRTK
ncbi:MAG: hypothetical protein KAT07_06540, partial [Calditrichia bacterium]|nr:hypothetical protein [Calditrichia bacterium]